MPSGGSSTLRRAAPWLPLAAIVLGSIAPLWWAALLPGQDLAAHLAYARIVRDHADPALPFGEQYRLMSSAQPYFTAYYLLIGLGRAVSILGAARLLCSAYVLGLFASVYFLARQAHPQEPRDRPPVAVYLMAPLVWNPTAAMGFLVFLLTLPLIVAGVASVLWTKARPRRAAAALVAICAAGASLHVFSVACLALAAVLIALFSRERRHAVAAGTIVAASGVTMALWRGLGELGVGGSVVQWSEGLRSAIGFEAVTHAFRIAWGTPPLKLTYAFYTAFGPYGMGGQLVTALGVATLVYFHRRGSEGATREQRRLLMAAGVFAAVAVALPWGIHLPSEFTFIDLRTMTVAALILVAMIPPGPFVAGKGRLAVMGFAFLCCLNLQHKFAAFSSQSRPVLQLLAQVDRGDRLSFLAFDGQVRGWGGLFRLSQTLPLYHTVLNGGINPQLWGRYSRHLPIEHLPGREPEAPPVWQPWEVEAKQLADVQAVLVQRPRPEGPARATSGFERASSLVDGAFRAAACEDGWCLHRRVR